MYLVAHIIMIAQLPLAAVTDNITYGEKRTTATLVNPAAG